MHNGCVFVGFSRELVFNMTEAISYELRGVYNDDIKRGVRGQSGLSCFSPVINIMRHPLWGRNQVRILRTMHVLWIKPEGQAPAGHVRMWRIPNAMESDFFPKFEICRILKIRLCRIQNLLFRSNSTSLNNSTLIDGEICCCVFFILQETIIMILINHC